MNEGCNALPKIGDYVLYRQSGIYRVADIREEAFAHTEKKTYLVLNSLHETRTNIFVPADRAHILSRLRTPLNEEQMKSAIKEASARLFDWIEDGRTRTERYAAILHGNSTTDILALYRTLFQKKQQLLSEKKKFYASDEKLLAEAERMAIDEVAFAFKTDAEGALCELEKSLLLS